MLWLALGSGPLPGSSKTSSATDTACAITSSCPDSIGLSGSLPLASGCAARPAPRFFASAGPFASAPRHVLQNAWARQPHNKTDSLQHVAAGAVKSQRGSEQARLPKQRRAPCTPARLLQTPPPLSRLPLCPETKARALSSHLLQYSLSCAGRQSFGLINSFIR